SSRRRPAGSASARRTRRAARNSRPSAGGGTMLSASTGSGTGGGAGSDTAPGLARQESVVMARTLDRMPAPDPRGLVAPPVVAALTPEVEVATIDPDLADTAAFCEAYGIGLDISANCVVLAAKHAAGPQLAACIVLATTRADVNGLARRTLGAK